MFADALSCHPDYPSQEVLLVQGTGATHEVIDILVDKCHEALSKGHPVIE